MRLKLYFRTGHHRGHALEFEAPRTLVLGRSSQADVQIYDERISRRHCAIRVADDAVRVKDMGSGNGTFVNGAEVRETVLADGDVVMIGRTEVECRIARAAAPAAIGPAPPPAPPTAFPQGSSGAGDALRQTVQERGPKACAFCQAAIPPHLMHLAVEHRGRFLCPRCAPRIEIPGYRMERQLGEGAMGVVYLAHCLRRNIPVALKVLKTRGELTPEDRARFIREASTAAQLEHENIVRVIDLGEAPPYLFFVMELVRGRSLKEWLGEHGPLPLPSVLKIAMQVAEALEHAGARHIVHRDIKPENILVQEDGLAKLADFGLAKNVMTAGVSNLTRPGDGLGTLPYMPPEQIENALYADHRSDIYSFGATVYHMLTGQAPFSARTTLQFFKMIRDEQPAPISQFRKDVPRVIEIMVEKTLRKDPAERYQQVGEIKQVLEQFLRVEFDTRQTAT